MHLNPKHYPRPFEFWPERWLDNTSNNDSFENEPTAVTQDPALARSAFAAFSTGSHSCVGKELAYMEMTLLLARILFLYDIKPAEDETKKHTGEGKGRTGQWGRRERGQYQIRDHFTSDCYRPWIQFRRRK